MQNSSTSPLFADSNHRRVHFVAICGVAMASVAAELHRAGFDVTGSDAGIYPPMSDFLAGQGLRVFEGFSPDNLPSDGLIVIGNAVSRGNVELEAALDRSLPLISLPELINRRYLASRPGLLRRSVVIAGTHGKTTTASLTAAILRQAGLNPGWMIGGIPRDLPVPCAFGGGGEFVIEGDEYDAVYYDKRPKFFHYRPHFAVLTSVEFDHADIYPDFAAVKDAFRKFVRLLPRAGRLVAWGDDDTVCEIAGNASCPVIFYGESAGCDWRLEMGTSGESTCGEILSPEGGRWTMEIPLPGRHNLLNALAALIVVREMGVSVESSLEILKSIKGVARRMELAGEFPHGGSSVVLYDDFAHHPTAVRETLSALKQRHPDRRLWAVFEPRSNTMVRKRFQNELAAAFNDADYVILGALHRQERLPEDERLDRWAVAAGLEQSGKSAWVEDSVEAIAELLGRHLRGGEVVALMSNGSFGGLKDKLIKKITGNG